MVTNSLFDGSNVGMGAFHVYGSGKSVHARLRRNVLVHRPECSHDGTVRILCNKIPVVIVAHENATDDMAGTVTFNRARGTHLLEPMEHIVKKLLDEGLQVDEISKKLGMSREEIFRLSKIDRETFLKLVTSRGDQKFSKAQVIRRG